MGRGKGELGGGEEREVRRSQNRKEHHFVREREREIRRKRSPPVHLLTLNFLQRNKNKQQGNEDDYFVCSKRSDVKQALKECICVLHRSLEQ